MSDEVKSAERETKIRALREKHPGKDIALIVVRGREFYVSTPSPADWDAFLMAAGDPKRRRAATHNLVMRSAVEPGPDALAEVVKKQPALVQTLGDKLGVLAGLDDEAELVLFSDA